MKAKGDFEVICDNCGEILIEFKDPDYINPEGCNGREGQSVMVTCKNCSNREKETKSTSRK